MSAEQVKSIFEPVIKQVVDLVEGQVEAIKAKSGRVSGIILVGGFGQSNYLYTRLKQHFNSAPPPAYTEQPKHETGGCATEYRSTTAVACVDGSGQRSCTKGYRR